MTGQPQYLRCHICGVPVHRLTPEQARRVASDPDGYVAYCSDCCRRDDPSRFWGFW